MIIADEACKDRLGAESGETTGDIGGTTRRGSPFEDFGNGDRGVRTELVELGVVELINHNVAEYENALRSGIFEEIGIKHKEHLTGKK